jgi:hypothetical protein
MESFQQRVVDEKTELDGRLERLVVFLSGERFRGLPIVERKRLRSQRKVMRRYSKILKERIAAFEKS